MRELKGAKKPEGNVWWSLVSKHMERDCMLAQGAPAVTRDRLMEQSDEFRMWFCQICGLPIVDIAGNPSKNIPPQRECRVCQTNKVVQIRLPYATKLVMQEFAGMNMIMRVLTTPYSGTYKCEDILQVDLGDKKIEGEVVDTSDNEKEIKDDDNEKEITEDDNEEKEVEIKTKEKENSKRFTQEKYINQKTEYLIYNLGYVDHIHGDGDVIDFLVDNGCDLILIGYTTKIQTKLQTKSKAKKSKEKSYQFNYVRDKPERKAYSTAKSFKEDFEKFEIEKEYFSCMKIKYLREGCVVFGKHKRFRPENIQSATDLLQDVDDDRLIEPLGRYKLITDHTQNIKFVYIENSAEYEE